MGRSSRNGASAGRAQASNSTDTASRANRETQKRRFGAYFPRAFACAYALTGDEAAATDIVSEAFVRVFAHPSELAEEEFIVELFTTARDLSRASSTADGRNGKLTDREQEVLAFVFDARLSREEIRRLMGTTEQGLSATLLRALRKLQAGIRPASVTA